MAARNAERYLLYTPVPTKNATQDETACVYPHRNRIPPKRCIAPFYHLAQNDYIRNSLINSKNNSSAINYIQKNITGLINSNRLGPVKITVVTEFLLLTGMTLAGSWSVVRGAHIQAFIFLHSADAQDHGRLPVVYISKHSHKTCLHVVDCLVRTAKEEGAVGTSTRANACAFTGNPLLSSYPDG